MTTAPAGDMPGTAPLPLARALHDDDADADAPLRLESDAA